jgi:hydroxypyruvate isomerase
MMTPFSRRSMLASAAAVAGAAAVARSVTAATGSTTAPETSPAKGKLNQSVCYWCVNKDSLETVCQWAKKLGMVGIDLLGPSEFPTLKAHGLVCTMVTSHGLGDGLCDTKFHASCIESISKAIEATAAAGYRNVICFSGNARGIDRQTGMKNCVTALKEVVPLAEKNNVTLCMELLNSKVDHADYMCDNSTWGVELCKQVGSDRFKLLYDIYHMQIMEGDIIRTIERDHQYFGHYHTAGNPGRHELDDTQELFYPPIAKAIAATGFDGYFAHEFIPTRDPLTGLTEAVQQCIV